MRTVSSCGLDLRWQRSIILTIELGGMKNVIHSGFILLPETRICHALRDDMSSFLAFPNCFTIGESSRHVLCYTNDSCIREVVLDVCFHLFATLVGMVNVGY